MPQRKFTIPSRRGEPLSALVDLPVDGAPTAFALLAHCFTCTKNYTGLYHLSRALTAEGIGVLRFDFAGLGESGGAFADTSLLSNVEDLVAAADFLGERFEAPKLLIGHSLGGQAVLMAAPAIPSAAAVVTLAAPADPRQVLRHLGPARETIAARGEAAVSISGRTFTLRRKFLDDLQGVDPAAVLAALQRPLLVLHSPRDEVVPIDNAIDLFRAAHQPKSMVALGAADHLLSQRADARYAGAVIAAWARPYVETTPAAAVAAPVESRITARTGDEGFATEIRAGRHRLTADEPAAAGGTDLGPTPFDMLVAALGACTAMTLRMYADRKGWPLAAATVRLSHRKMHASECTSCETREGMLDRIEREVELEGPLDSEQKQRLLQIADRCPVHRTLTSETVIATRLKDEPERRDDDERAQTPHRRVRADLALRNPRGIGRGRRPAHHRSPRGSGRSHPGGPRRGDRLLRLRAPVRGQRTLLRRRLGAQTRPDGGRASRRASLRPADAAGPRPSWGRACSDCRRTTSTSGRSTTSGPRRTSP